MCKMIWGWSLCLVALLCADNNRFLWDDWSTHQPVLYAVAKATKGPIIEFGCGHGSTDLLHAMCEKEGRLLITLEDDWNWMNRFTQKYLGQGYNADNSGWHRFYYVPGKRLDDLENPAHWIAFMDHFDLLSSLDFDVCFIDQSPWLARYETLQRMKNKARFVVIHDVDYFPTHHIFGTTIQPIVNRQEGRFDFSDVFSSFCVYFPNQPWPADTGPPTLVGSNFESSLPLADYSQPIFIKSVRP